MKGEPEKCECTLPDCPVHEGHSSCGNVAEVVLQRGDDTSERVLACRPCAKEATADEGTEFDSWLVVRELEAPRCEWCGEPGTPDDPLKQIVTSPPVSGHPVEEGMFHLACARDKAKEDER